MLSVLIPSYNHEDFIIVCLTEVLKIKISPIKIIIIDDGSEDNTCSVVDDFIACHPSIDISFIQKTNQGVVSSLNMGLEMVVSEFIYLCASDDIPNAKGIERCIEILKKDRNKLFIIGGSNNRVGDTLHSSYRISHNKFFAASTQKIREEMFFDYPKPLLLQSTIFRTSCLKTVGGWDKDIVIDDYSMFIKLFNAFDRESYIFNSSINVVDYRIHMGNSSKNPIRQYATQRQLFKKYAPIRILNRAIGYRLTFHLLGNLKKCNFRNIIMLLRDSSFTQIFYSFIYIPKMLLKILKGDI